MSVGYRILAYVVVAFALIFGLYRWGFGNGIAHEKVTSQAEIAKIQEQHNADLALAEQAKDEAEAKAAHIQDMTNRQLADLSNKYQEEIANEKQAAEIRAAQYRSNERRLRVAVQSCSASGGKVPGSAGTGPVADGSGTAELSPEAAASVVTVADDADRVVNKLSALQDYVSTVLKNFGPQ